ncbi:hypothetical protein NHX12_014625 [Muraenolepis orangiensis]|uniref:Inactive dual specificity phosphatase 27 n=1 Tax=Muraenolepis orangiensis TaxID=630683 RepID=A0A9Q0D915_9TELE|nr:hypothetical protein NHX12_014625 [Muraenolepis orangiensis]
MASESESVGPGDQQSSDPDGDGEAGNVMSIQSHYLRSPSPSNFSMVSDSRFSMISGSDAESIFMEPIHLSSAIAAKQIINEELPPRSIRAESIPESMLETAEQLMVEDLYNRVRDMIDDRSPYNTPCVLDIQRAMVQDRLEAPMNSVDEVWSNVFIAEKSVAVNKARLKRMGVTHILNAAHATGVYTGAAFYSGMDIQYMGVEVDDFADADLSPHFRSTAEFLDEALLTHKGKVLVVSMMGVSRSASLVASYLMIFQHMSIMEALTTMRKKRAINPNEGFLKQLRELNENLMEERDDDDDTLSQCSVIDARAIFGDAMPDDDEGEGDDGEEERSMIGVKAHSIMMEEEEDAASVASSAMSSVASSAAAAALRNGPMGVQSGPATQRNSEGHEEPVLPGQDGGGQDSEDDDGVGSMIREWRERNEKFQSDDWWEAQLNCDGEDAVSLPGRTGTEEDGDLESVALSDDIRAMNERLKRRPKRPPSDSVSTSSCTSYSDLWKQRLREIEEQAAARYRKKDEDESSESTITDAGDVRGGGGGGKKKIDDDVKSLLSDTSSMYNFCQRNKEKLTPLERWRVKRIQFGWNKTDGEDGERSSVSGAGGGDDREGEVRTPALEDVNLTAYQNWKLKQQRRYGEENKDEIVELSRGEDSASIKRKQRREEILERSRKNLEESKSMCGWETESCVSGGTVPLSAFWAGAGVTQSVANDDNMSMLSGRSSVISSVSQSRGARMAQSIHPAVPPILPVPTVMGPGGEPMVNLASIQNWIANVVSETILQKQSEMSLPPPSQAGSVLNYGRASSRLSGSAMDDDRASVLSAASYTSKLPARGGAPSRAESILSAGSASGASGRHTGYGSAGLGSAVGSSLASKRNKITTTSVPLYSLFQDQVDLKKLDSMDKEMKSEMRGKMATYEKKKILEDNKRSTLFKKKKPREDEEEEEERKTKEEEFLAEQKRKVEKPARSYGLSGCLNLNPVLEKEKNTSVDDWLISVRPPPRKTAEEVDPYDDLDASASEFDFPSRRVDDEEEEEGYAFTSRYRSRLGRGLDEDGSPELVHQGTKRTGLPSNGFPQSSGYSSAGRSYGAYGGKADEGTDGNLDSSSRYKHTARYEGSDAGGRSSWREEARKERGEAEGNDDEDDDVATFMAQTRQRIKARAAAEVIDDEVLEAWRAQQESKTNSQN